MAASEKVGLRPRWPLGVPNHRIMEIGVADDKIIKYTIYANNNNIELSSEDWMMIKNHAEKFLPEAIADEEG